MFWKVAFDIYICFAEHFNPLLQHISKLEEALYNIQFEQHWLEAQTDRQAIGKYLTLKLLLVINCMSIPTYLC